MLYIPAKLVGVVCGQLVGPKCHSTCSFLANISKNRPCKHFLVLSLPNIIYPRPHSLSHPAHEINYAYTSIIRTKNGYMQQPSVTQRTLW